MNTQDAQTEWWNDDRRTPTPSNSDVDSEPERSERPTLSFADDLAASNERKREEEEEAFQKRLHAPREDDSQALQIEAQRREAFSAQMSRFSFPTAPEGETWSIATTGTKEAWMLLKQQDDVINKIAPDFSRAITSLAKTTASKSYEFLEREVEGANRLVQAFMNSPALRKRSVKESILLCDHYITGMEATRMQAESIMNHVAAHKSRTVSLLVKMRMEMIDSLLEKGGGVKVLRQLLSEGRLTSRSLLKFDSSTETTSTPRLNAIASTITAGPSNALERSSTHGNSIVRSDMPTEELVSRVTDGILDMNPRSTKRYSDLDVPENNDEQLRDYEELTPAWLDNSEDFSYDSAGLRKKLKWEDLSPESQESLRSIDKTVRDVKRLNHINNQYEGAMPNGKEAQRGFASSMAFLSCGPLDKAISMVKRVSEAADKFHESKLDEEELRDREQLRTRVENLKLQVAKSEEIAELSAAGEQAKAESMSELLAQMQGILQIQEDIRTLDDQDED